MFANMASIGTLLTLNLLFVGVALAIGFTLGAWFFRSSAMHAEDSSSRRKNKLNCSAPPSEP